MGKRAGCSRGCPGVVSLAISNEILALEKPTTIELPLGLSEVDPLMVRRMG